MKPKRILSLLLTVALLAGLFLFNANAFADSSKLQQMIDALGVPNPLPTEYGPAWARLDRGQLVFGSPAQVPNNDWKAADPDTDGKDWQTANNIDLGHPGQEPRYLGFTYQGDLFSNDWFPVDLAFQAPAKRDMIAEPWGKGKTLCSGNAPGISDYTWGVILRSLENYNETVGFPGWENSYANNSAFGGQFNLSAVKQYFKVLTEPKPGLTGAVREWHYRNGVPYYDTITIAWLPIPNFSIESIDPGTDTAKLGETYHGKAMFKLEGDMDFLGNPQTSALYNVAFGSGSVHLTEQYSAPIAVTVGNSLTDMTETQTVQPIPVNGVKDLYKIGEGEYEADFDWQVPKGFSGNALTIGTEINDTEHVIPNGAWPYIEYSEVKLDDNYKSVQVPVIQENLVVKNLTFSENPAQPGDSVTVSADVENDCPKDVTTPVQGFFNSSKASERQVTIPAGGTVRFTFDITAPDAGDYEASVTVNPNHDSPTDETTYADNTASGTLHVENEAAPSPAGDSSLSFQVVNQATVSTVPMYTLDGKPAKKITRSPGTAKWTDTVTATLTATKPPQPKLSKGVFIKFDDWEIASGAILTYPLRNTAFSFGNPVEPAGTKSITLTDKDSGPPQATATASFVEDWSHDGYGVYDILTKTHMAEQPKSYTLTATYILNYHYDYKYYVPGDPGPPATPGYWVTVRNVPSSTGALTATGTLTVDGAGAAPVTSGNKMVIVSINN